MKETNIEMDTKKVQRTETDYPKVLLQYEKAPETLYYKGRLPKEGHPTVAMVGARACSNYGRYYARKWAEELSQAGVQIISGLARGIDTYAQLGALEGGTPTFAVLGCGVDYCYPEENIELYNDIIRSGGGILSEYKEGEKPLAWHFPQRNRIISGLADVVVVLEAKPKSGSLITVEWALEQGKDVMAMPGPVGEPLSEGCNQLIRAGAGIVTCVEDILELLQLQERPAGKIPVELELALKEIYEALGHETKTVEDLVATTEQDFGTVLEGLFQLQKRGLVHQVMGQYYERK